ncbi:MAG: acyltransferase [Bacteroidales bacterium]|jgi:hypothetical protein|nr:acyltransferase [Bacteroidales bacterium]
MAVLSLQSSQRIVSLRFLLIVLVVFAHANITEVNFTEGTQAFAIPSYIQFIRFAISDVIARCEVSVFFFISGFLLYSKMYPFSEVFSRRSKSILLPYILWNLLVVGMFFVMQSFSFTQAYFSNPDNIIRNFGFIDWVDIFWGKLTTTRNGYPMIVQFWFLRDLYIMSLLCYVLKWIIDKIPLIFLCIITVVWIFNIELYIVAPRALLFFSLSYYAVKYGKQIDTVDVIPFKILIPVYALTVLTQSYLYFHEVKLNTISIFTVLAGGGEGFGYEITKMLLHATNVLLGFIMLWRISAVFIRHETLYNVLAWLSAFNFFVYATHEPLLTMVNKIMAKYIHVQGFGFLLQYFALAFGIISITLVAGVIMKRFLPTPYAILTGGRLNPFFVKLGKN